jgi:hypothetical protein
VFTDTLTYRGQFHIDLSATNFLSSVALPYPYTSGVYNIPAANLAITENYNPHQVRWSSMNDSWGLPVPTYHVGDMGSTKSDGSYSSNDEAWSSNNTMDSSHTVTIAFAGTGTIGTFQKIDMSLLVPAALPAGAYVSTITATLYNTASLP